MKYKFNGQWNFDYQFDAFAGLQNRRSSYTGKGNSKLSDGMVNATLMEVENDDDDPLLEQIATINYMLEHPNEIQAALLKGLHEYSVTIQKVHFKNVDSEEAQGYFPVLQNLEQYKDTFGVGNLFLMMHNKSGYAYYGLECGTDSDDEHGLGFVMHLDQVIKIGQADISFSEWSAMVDLGIKETNYPPKIKTKIYNAHPKFNTIKPSHQDANNEYGHRLIRDNNFKDFKSLIEDNKQSINFTARANSWSIYTYIITAIRSNRKQFFDYLIEKEANLDGCLELAAQQDDFYYLTKILKAGRNINEINKSGVNILAQKLGLYLSNYVNSYSDEVLTSYLEKQKSRVAHWKSQNMKFDESRHLQNPKALLPSIANAINYFQGLGAALSDKELSKLLSVYTSHEDFNLIQKECNRLLR